MDGIGLGAGGPDDAVASAHTPNLDRYLHQHPSLSLTAHGPSVGLPSTKDMGNSEVGHNAIGAGRVFDQGAKLVDQAIAHGTAWNSPVWKELVQRPTLHLIGLVSDGNVHSHIDHLIALIDRAALDGVQRLFVHVLTDGRDVPARSAMDYIPRLEACLSAHKTCGRNFYIASGGGRMRITMDRYEAEWDMVERGWRCHVLGDARPFSSATEAIQTLYEEDPEVTDQTLPAFVIANAQGPIGPICDHHGVLFFNFRGDRAIEISRAFDEPDFSMFPQPNRPAVYYAGMMQYDGDLQLPNNYLVSPPAIDRTVGEYLVGNNLRSFACSETQKYGHVTYFFNGNRSGLIDATRERYLEIPSDTCAFNTRPQMKAVEITDAVEAAIHSMQYQHVRLNLANGDMVGHTGDLAATRLAVETVDLQLARLEAAVRATDGILLVTADHGNADEMYLRKKGAILRHSDGSPLARTSHTLNPVPFCLIDPRSQLRLRQGTASGIASVGTTILELCGLTPPEGYLPGLIEP